MRSFIQAIAHVDVDCFFAAVEVLDNPLLEGKPVLVCTRTDRRGIVVSASYEARVPGIHAGTPVFKAQQLCPQGIFIPAHFERYKTLSFRLMQLLKKISPSVEPSSIDEAYIDLTGLRLLYRRDYAGIAALIQQRVKKQLNLSVSVGVSMNKLLAKIASDFRKPGGLTVVSKKNRGKFLKKITIGDVPGIGINTEALLRKFGCATAYDIAAAPSAKFKSLMGKRGEDLHKQLNGEKGGKITPRETLPKSLSNTRTFPNFSADRNYIFSYSLNLLIELSRRLRSYGLESGLMAFFLLTKDFQTFGLKKNIGQPTDDETALLRIFKEIFAEVFRGGIVYRKSGFFFGDMRMKGPPQTSLFDFYPASHSGLQPALDDIYEKFGARSIIRATLL